MLWLTLFQGLHSSALYYGTFVKEIFFIKYFFFFKGEVLCTPVIYIYFLPWHLFRFESCQDTLIVWCIYIYIDVQALIIK